MREIFVYLKKQCERPSGATNGQAEVEVTPCILQVKR